jgi:hypothetical protein
MIQPVMSFYSLPAKRYAFLGHRLALSAVLLALFLGLLRLAWYPDLYFQLGGVGKQVAVLVAVVLVIGSGLSTLVFKPGKRGLHKDLAIILVVELAAFAWFGYQLFETRPRHLVFAIDRFQVVEASGVADFPYRFEELAAPQLVGPRLVVAGFPDDQVERAALKKAIFFEGAPDIDVRPDQWYPYVDANPAVLSAARPLAELRERGTEYAESVDRWLERHSGEAGDYVFLPVAGSKGDATAILSASQGTVLDMIDLDPWE